MTKEKQTKEKQTFEQKIGEIEKIAKQLQSADTELETAVKLYEHGMKLANEVDKQLSGIERRIEIVTSSYNSDEVISEPYETPQN